MDLSTASADGTLGQTLELHARYVRSEADMLHRRTGLMMDYEAANRGLEKTKAQRRSAVSTQGRGLMGWRLEVGVGVRLVVRYLLDTQLSVVLSRNRQVVW